MAESKRNSAIAALQVIYLVQQLAVGKPTIGDTSQHKAVLGDEVYE
jgi:hypothetical protein